MQNANWIIEFSSIELDSIYYLSFFTFGSIVDIDESSIKQQTQDVSDLVRVTSKRLSVLRGSLLKQLSFLKVEVPEIIRFV